jgi:tellurite resistance protein
MGADMRLRIKQARPLDLNDAIRHVVVLQAFLSSEVKLQETKGFVRAVERNPPNIKSSKTGQLLKNITEILASLQSDLKVLKGQTTK